MSYMKGDLLTKTRKLVKGLAKAEPRWLKAMEQFVLPFLSLTKPSIFNLDWFLICYVYIVKMFDFEWLVVAFAFATWRLDCGWKSEVLKHLNWIMSTILWTCLGLEFERGDFYLLFCRFRNWYCTISYSNSYHLLQIPKMHRQNYAGISFFVPTVLIFSLLPDVACFTYGLVVYSEMQTNHWIHVYLFSGLLSKKDSLSFVQMKYFHRTKMDDWAIFSEIQVDKMEVHLGLVFFSRAAIFFYWINNQSVRFRL